MQRGQCSKKRKVSMDIQWNRDDIQIIYQQHGLQQRSSKKKKAVVLQQYFLPFRRLSIDDICSCLRLLRCSKERSVFISSFAAAEEPETNALSMDYVQSIEARNQSLREQLQSLTNQLLKQEQLLSHHKVCYSTVIQVVIKRKNFGGALAQSTRRGI